jgi:hypothetical protein
MSPVRNPNRPILEALELRRHLAINSGALPISFGGPGFDNAQRIVSTPTGAIVTGLFSGTIDFDPTPDTGILTARGDSDIYIASYATDGSLNWALRAGGNFVEDSFEDYEDRSPQINPARYRNQIGKVGELPEHAGEYVNDLAVDAAGNIYVVGSFRETITVGAQTLTANADFNDDYHDALVLKIDPNGNLLWSRAIGGAFDDTALSVGLDATGNVFVGGYYTRRADFDPSSRVHMLETPGRDAGYVMRMSTDGALSWVYQFNSEATDPGLRNAVNDIAVTASGNVYFAGVFAEEADFDPSRKKYVLEADDLTDAVFGLLNRKGQLAFAMRTGGEQADGNLTVAIGPDGGVYTGGYFSDEVDVDPRKNVTRIFEATPEDPGRDPRYADLLISRFEADGTPTWQAQLGGGYLETISDMKIGADGSIYTIGSFFNTADFAPGPSEVRLSSTNSDVGRIRDSNFGKRRNETYDWFVSRLSPRGKYISATRIGGGDDDFGSGLFVDGSNVYAVGRAVSTRIAEREDRDETSLILLLDAALNRVS